MTGYSFIDRLLYRLALGIPTVAEMTFSLDQAMARSDTNAVADGQHVFVSGLARAGTTVLMRRIHASGAYRSLTYRDMPFVLAPNLWRRLRGSRGRVIAPAERAHGDGLIVDADSPESLDEVFWRIFDGAGYIRADRLTPHRPDDALLARFRSYVSAILSKSGHGRYLSKNNNNVLRLPALASAFPRAVILIPFRDPVDQAASLLAQHLRFRQMHRDDRFSQRYMTWLVHHEFGADHRPFVFADKSARSTHSDLALAYWLDQWITAYRWLLETAPEQGVFICYEDLCADPAIWAGIAERLDLPAGPAPEELAFQRRKSGADPDALDVAQIASAREIYDELKRHAGAARRGI